jgi:predicted DNA binding CopG/RHH family protein
MSARDEEILKSMGMTIEEVDEIADACEAGDYSMWDSSKVSYGNPFEEELTAVSVRLPKSRVNAIKRAAQDNGISRSEFIRRAIDHELLTTV